MKKQVVVPKQPSKKEVEKYLKIWNSSKSYVLQESSLQKLFLKTYPENHDMDDVLIKVCALNVFYNAHILDPSTMAKHICSLKIDKDLFAGNLNLVERIARVKMRDGRTRNFYSFATKYCSHHKALVFPIYDFFVEKMLIYFKRTDNFYNFRRDDLKFYDEYKNILMEFKKFYNLEDYSLKQIDKYLWQLGKKSFPREY